jgi:3-hydroxyisobutyrate dehydrogenase-like beta-hydroxyacid dehydrogenase
VSLAAKDLRLVDAAARAADRPLPGVEVALRAFEDAEQAGREDEDYAAVIDHIEHGE